MGIEVGYERPFTSFYRNLSPTGGIIGSTLVGTAYLLDSSLSIIRNTPYPVEHVLALPVALAIATWGGITIPALYRRAVEVASEVDQKTKALEAFNRQTPEHTRENLRNGFHLLLMCVPNIFHPRKALNNLRHPVHEVFHTKHKQYPIEANPDIHVVEHTLFGRLVTVDVIRRSRFPKPLILRFKQLFERDFYYGHAQYFPKPFRLIDRTYIEDAKSFNVNSHVSKILESAPLEPD